MVVAIPAYLQDSPQASFFSYVCPSRFITYSGLTHATLAYALEIRLSLQC